MALRLERGVLIAIEGIDGAGKTTQARRLVEHLSRTGFEVVATKEPTNGPFGQRIRESATKGRLEPEEELRTFIADRREHVAQLIAPALAARKIVIVDRYYYSTAAYQGMRGLDPDRIITENEAFAPRPDMLIHLDIPTEVSTERIEARGDGIGNLFERRADLEICARIFRTIQGSFVLRLDGTETEALTGQRILRALDEGPLFRAACHKPQLVSCEPRDCEYRIEGRCDYPTFELGRPSAAVAADESRVSQVRPGS